MIRLGTDTKEEYSPTKKTFYKRRRLFKPLTRLCFITLILSLFALLNHNVRKSLSEHHYYIPKEFSLFHSSAKPLGIPLEHDHLEHLASPAADEEIPIHVFDNLPVRGAYYMVVRNEDLQGAKSVIRSMKDNMPDGKLRYPFIFLNNQDFTPDFRKYIRRLLGSGNIYFGKIDGHAWDYPSFIDVKRAERLMLRQGYKGVYRGYSLSTRQMLRYHAGLYFHHPLFKNVDYSWRVEPGAEYTCQMDTDPFLTMKMKKKKIGIKKTSICINKTTHLKKIS
jgi:alpha 1,2-mannosyltransferase